MKKIITILITLLLFTGCSLTSKDIEAEKLSYYLLKLENFKTREKNINNTVDDEEFDAFLDTIFYDYIGENFLSMHFSVTDYKKMNITKPEVNCGKIKYELDLEELEKLEKELAELKKFDYDKLSYRQQYDYEVEEYNIYETILQLCCWEYEFIFTSSDNMIEDIDTEFMNYTFYDQESLDDYMTCLKDIDRYLDDCLEYTKKQADRGLYLLDTWIDDVSDYGYSLIDANEITFISSFNSRIEKLDFLTRAEKDKYIKENEEIVYEEVLPSIEKVLEDLAQYYDKADYDKHRLSVMSRNYAKAQYYLNSSTNYNLEETFKLLKNTFIDLCDNFVYTLTDEELYGKTYELIYEPSYPFTLDAKGILDYLMDNANVCYPDLGTVEYDIDYLSDETGSSSTKAYYFNAPLDNLDQNIIKVNPNACEPGLDTFMTLAHEGIPGHLFQNIYNLKNGQHRFRRTMGFIGYTEGYAVMAERDCLTIGGVDDERVVDTAFFDNADYFIMYSIIDIGVNYFNWKPKDIKTFFNKGNIGLIYNFDDDIAQSFYDFAIEYPLTYIPYGVGYTELLNLRNNAKEALQDEFELSEYNNYVLRNGAIPFVILKTCIDEYTSSK